MNKVLILASVLTFPLLALPKLPTAKIRVAVSKAIRAGDTNAFAAVLAEHGLHANSVFLSGGYTLLHEAVAEGSAEIVKYLLEQDAEVNAASEYGHTSLDEATAFGDAEVVTLLEQAGATHGEGFRIGAAPTASENEPSVNTSVDPLAVDLHRDRVERFIADHIAAYGDERPTSRLAPLAHDGATASNVRQREGVVGDGVPVSPVSIEVVLFEMPEE